MESLFLTLALLALGVSLLLALFTWRRSRGLQRRLFVLLLAVSVVPAAVVFAVTLTNDRRSAEVLDAPGLQSSLDSALHLAREALSEERIDLQAWALRWSTGTAPETDAEGTGRGVALALRADEPGATRVRGGPDDAAWLRDEADRARGRDSWRTLREEREWLVVRMAAGSGWVLAARPLPEGLAQDLESIEAGSRGVAQWRLYYGGLLRARTLFLASGTFLGLLLASVLASRWVARRLAAPVADLVEGTRRVAAGDLETRVQTHATEDLEELVEAFNRMTRELAEGQRQLRRSERIAAWRGIARRLAHEIKNPLTPIHLSLHRLRKQHEEGPVREGLDVILQETQHLQKLADDFSLLARLPEPRRQAVALGPLFEQIVALYAPRSEFRFEGPAEGVWLDADEGQLRQVSSNLVKNAVESAGDTVRLCLRVAVEEEGVRLEFEDDGPGLPPELASDPESIFEPEFTTRSSGTGLGLAIVRRIVEDHGGSISARNSSAGGCVFALMWPAAASPNSGEGD